MELEDCIKGLLYLVGVVEHPIRFSELIDTDRERHRARETANIICFIVHKSTGNKTHPMKKR
uniref:Uncharacterized protein n=1 Tax=Gossypium raimondii TaxID=29730 RepID=A0A0D2QRA0_GOSRA|nr:hypothetical protein B456_004G036700 [Gossypium raimondii]